MAGAAPVGAVLSDGVRGAGRPLPQQAIALAAVVASAVRSRSLVNGATVFASWGLWQSSQERVPFGPVNVSTADPPVAGSPAGTVSVVSTR